MNEWLVYPIPDAVNVEEQWCLVEAALPSQQITINDWDHKKEWHPAGGNDGLNQCCYSSQWNLHPLKSTMLFLQLREGERMDVCKYLFSFCVGLWLNPRSSMGNVFPSICCCFFLSPPFLLFLYVLLFFSNSAHGHFNKRTVIEE